MQWKKWSRVKWEEGDGAVLPMQGGSEKASQTPEGARGDRYYLGKGNPGPGHGSWRQAHREVPVGKTGWAKGRGREWKTAQAEPWKDAIAFHWDVKIMGGAGLWEKVRRSVWHSSHHPPSNRSSKFFLYRLPPEWMLSRCDQYIFPCQTFPFPSPKLAQPALGFQEANLRQDSCTWMTSAGRTPRRNVQRSGRNWMKKTKSRTRV